MRKVALIGAGYISKIHAEALAGIPNREIVAVVDPAIDRARRLAGMIGCRASADIGTLLDGGCDAAHVLVPPPLHRTAAEPLLRAGIHVLLEKPMAASSEETSALQAAARASGACLSVNHNFVHHPAFARLKSLVDAGRLGRLRHVSCSFSMPLRQMESRQFGHWMFASPLNLLLEQAVHPLSQLDALIGPAETVKAVAAKPRGFGEGVEIVDTWLVSLVGAAATAQLHVSLGRTAPVYRITAVCDDGTAVADCIANRLMHGPQTRWIDPVDQLAMAGALAGGLIADGTGNLVRFGLSTLGLRGRSDPFFISMRDSIAAFHRSLDGGTIEDGAGGARLVGLCERISADAAPALPSPRPVAAPAIGRANRFDALVIGGTGFIGRHVVARLLARDRRVSVLARNVEGLPALFQDPRVGLFKGSVGDPEAVLQAMDGAPVVINLAHGGGAESWEEHRQAIVEGARAVADCVLSRGGTRLVHLSTTAALDLGDPRAVITGATPCDPKARHRSFYARAKAEAEEVLASLHRERGLPVTILRPGIVVGDGGLAFHGGVGFYNRPQHCLGWNSGDNPLPFVLVEDVADAVVRAAETPAAAGRTYNVIGDVRLSASDYTRALAGALGRPLRYHPQSVLKLQGAELGKWAVKRLAGRRVPLPSYHDLRSRGMLARFDTQDIKQDLGWQPVADRAEFIRRAIEVHGS